MPIYEFECTNSACKRTFEEITIHSRAQLGWVCPECGCRALHVMSCANFHTDETRARRILSKGRKGRGTRGRGASIEEKYGESWYEKTGRNPIDDMESGKKIND